MISRKDPISIAYCFVLVCLLAWFFLYNYDNTILQKIEVFSVDHLALAWLLMLAFSVFRAFIPFIPSVFFYAMCGRIFSGRLLPFLVNLSFMILLHILSYLIGMLQARFSTSRIDMSVEEKRGLIGTYKRVKDRFYRRARHAVSSGSMKILFVFSLSFFPEKAFGRICGRSKIPFHAYLFSATLGSLPSMISTTLLGKSLSDPSSPFFCIALALTLAVSIVSFIIYKKSNTKEITHEKSH